jgi:DNA-binding XRE family transcriptional regulator
MSPRREFIVKRMDMGLSPEAAAQRIGIARGTLLRFERGDSLSLTSAKLIADFWGCKVTDMIPFEDLDEAA